MCVRAEDCMPMRPVGLVSSVTARALGVKPQLRLIDGGRGTSDVSLDGGAADSDQSALARDSKPS